MVEAGLEMSVGNTGYRRHSVLRASFHRNGFCPFSQSCSPYLPTLANCCEKLLLLPLPHTAMVLSILIYPSL